MKQRRNASWMMRGSCSSKNACSVVVGALVVPVGEHALTVPPVGDHALIFGSLCLSCPCWCYGDLTGVPLSAREASNYDDATGQRVVTSRGAEGMTHCEVRNSVRG